MHGKLGLLRLFPKFTLIVARQSRTRCCRYPREPKAHGADDARETRCEARRTSKREHDQQWHGLDSTHALALPSCGLFQCAATMRAFKENSSPPEWQENVLSNETNTTAIRAPVAERCAWEISFDLYAVISGTPRVRNSLFYLFQRGILYEDFKNAIVRESTFLRFSSDICVSTYFSLAYFKVESLFDAKLEYSHTPTNIPSKIGMWNHKNV